MKTMEQALADHQALRPDMPRGLHAQDPAFIEWHEAFAAWCTIKQRMVGRLNAHRGMQGLPEHGGGA